MDLGDANFREVYNNNDIVIIDFWAAWCGPCQAFAPTYKKVAEDYPDIVFGKVNTEEEQKLAKHFSVRSIPTLMAIRDGLEVFYQPGSLDETTLRQLVEEVKNANMDDVRKRIEAEEKKNS